MDAKLKAKWVKALRSGRYKQGGGAIYDQGKYCCLGVLCRAAGGKLSRNNIIQVDGERVLYLLSGALLRRFGLTSQQEIRLANMNDGLGTQKRSFRKIADYIEKNL